MDFEEKKFQTKVARFQGGQTIVSLNLTLTAIFKVVSRVTLISSMGTHIFHCRFAIYGKKYATFVGDIFSGNAHFSRYRGVTSPLPSALALPNVHHVEVADRILHIIGPEKGRLNDWLLLPTGSKSSNALLGVHSPPYTFEPAPGSWFGRPSMFVL